jgi:protoporphyrinogen oxidase
VTTGDRPGRIVIVGAGPCGLACGRELARLGHSDWVIVERNSFAGGHASSVVDGAGFTWDLGGHVVFSHFGEFDRLVDDVMGDDLEEHERSSFVRSGDRWVPYPFQNNLRYLRREDVYDCVVGLLDAVGGSSDMDFGSWIEATFGKGIAHLFMRPYNEKIWATPLDRMSSSWIAERVSVVDARRALRNVLLAEDDLGWGPNSTFRFPSAGGTGEIYRRVAEQLGNRIEYGRELVAVDVDRHRIGFADGSETGYDALVSTMPIDQLVATAASCPDEVRAAAGALVHTGIWMVGVGYEQPLRDDRCWMYFPDPSDPFYRVTNFAKYAAANVPGGDTSRFSSFLTETSYSDSRPRDPDGLPERVVDSLAAAGLADGNVASMHVVDVPYAYPVPTRDRDRALSVIQPWLMQHGIYSRGRFGSWRYEIGNMDHAAKMGIDTARLLVQGTPEDLWRA